MATRPQTPMLRPDLAAFFLCPPAPRQQVRKREPLRGVLAELARNGRPL